MATNTLSNEEKNLNQKTVELKRLDSELRSLKGKYEKAKSNKKGLLIELGIYKRQKATVKEITTEKELGRANRQISELYKEIASQKSKKKKLVDSIDTIKKDIKKLKAKQSKLNAERERVK